LNVYSKGYLLPDEFKQTTAFQKHPNWDGRADDGQDTTLLQKIPFQLPKDTNMEEESMDRADHRSVCGMLLELGFKKKVIGGDHLKPSYDSYWSLIEERIKPGKSFREVAEARLQEQNIETVTETVKKQTEDDEGCHKGDKELDDLFG